MSEIVKSKVTENKEEKKRKLLDSAFSSFTEKGVKNTSIQDIVDGADIAKGTFYLYFKDKEDIQDYLITKKSSELIQEAVLKTKGKRTDCFADNLINVIDYIIDKFKEDKTLLDFISKNLTWGVFGEKITTIIDNSTDVMFENFKKAVKDGKIKIKNPELTIFMIGELTSSVVFCSVIYGKPLPIDEMKPFLYEKIRKMIEE